MRFKKEKCVLIKIMSHFAPDANTKLTHLYHKSSKFMIPSICASYLLNDTVYGPYVNSASVINVGFHSYFSTSCILTDYVKNVNLSRISRICNLKLHSLATIGIIMFNFKE